MSQTSQSACLNLFTFLYMYKNKCFTLLYHLKKCVSDFWYCVPYLGDDVVNKRPIYGTLGARGEGFFITTYHMNMNPYQHFINKITINIVIFIHIWMKWCKNIRSGVFQLDLKCLFTEKYQKYHNFAIFIYKKYFFYQIRHNFHSSHNNKHNWRAFEVAIIPQMTPGRPQMTSGRP